MNLVSSGAVSTALFPLLFAPAVIFIACDFLAGREADAEAE
jgi:hypothetical protein